MSYVRCNPKLSNPVDWSKVAAVSGDVAAVAAFGGTMLVDILLSISQPARTR